MLVLLIFKLLMLADRVQSGARLEILLGHYRNPSEHDYSGHCCDWLCIGQCDHIFTFCLDSYGDNTDIQQCQYFRKQTRDFHDTNIVTFTSNMRGVTNPLTHDFQSWPGGATLKINVQDHDSGLSGSYDDVDKLYISFRTAPAKSESQASWTQTTVVGVRAHDRTALTMSWRVYCEEHYFGHNCATHCLARNDDNGHYWCDPDTGDMICRPEWEDPSRMCVVFSDDCAGIICANNGTCVDGNRDFTCTCQPGFTGKTCAIDINECDSQPCQNGGTCTEGQDSFSCECTALYVGPQCEDHICTVQSPCLNGGTCYGNGSCFCLPGFVTDNCGIHLCDVKSCQNGGMCDEETGLCSCPPGFIGNLCNVDLCSLVSCEFGGSCVEGHCLCLQGFTGRYCHNVIDHCLSDPCDHDAPCISSLAGFTCRCLPDYNGTLCENVWSRNETFVFSTLDANATSSYDVPPPVPLWALASLSALVLVLFIITCIATVVCMRHRRLQNSGAAREVTSNDAGCFINPVYTSEERLHAVVNTTDLPSTCNTLCRTITSTEPNVYDDLDLLKENPYSIPRVRLGKRRDSDDQEGYFSTEMETSTRPDGLTGLYENLDTHPYLKHMTHVCVDSQSLSLTGVNNSAC